jgi:hypothetical protein
MGVPDVPGSARGRFLELELAEIERRLRGQLKNVDAVEAQVGCPSCGTHLHIGRALTLRALSSLIGHELW